MTQSTKLYGYFAVAWQNGYLILIIVLSAITVFLTLFFLTPKTYIFKSNVIIKDYNNPITADKRNQNQWTPQLVTTFLHSRPTLESIANESGFIDSDLPHFEKEARLTYLHQYLTAEVKDSTLITITYTSQKKEVMIKILEAASQIFINHHNSTFSNLGVDFNQARTILSSIDRNIASKQAELASLSTRYTKDHSSIQKISKELQGLKKEKKRVNMIEESLKNVSLNQRQINLQNGLGSISGQPKDGQFRITKLIKIGIIPKMPLSSEPLFIVLYLLGGIFAGVGLSIGIILLERSTSTSLKGKDQLEQLIEIPVLSRIPLL